MTDAPVEAGEAEELFRRVLPNGAEKLVLGVSGGADSTALLMLAAISRAAIPGLSLHVVTVDHGLRPEAAEEAQWVAALCDRLGLPHRILHWTPNFDGNLSAHAREARYALLADEAWRIGATTVLTAHHADDQVESHLLAQERGATGAALAGMRLTRALRPGLTLARPFLPVPGARLRATLRAMGQSWLEDPTNANTDYARARIRAELRDDRARYDAATQALSEAQAVRQTTDRALACALANLRADYALTVENTGEIHLERRGLANLPQPLRRALLARMVTAAGGGLNTPPREKQLRLLRLVETDARVETTLGGALIRADRDRLWLAREYGRAGIEGCEIGDTPLLWFDRRFVIATAGLAAGSTVLAFGALGRGNAITKCLPVVPDRRGGIVAGHDAIPRRKGEDFWPLVLSACVGWRLWADLPAPESDFTAPAPVIGCEK